MTSKKDQSFPTWSFDKPCLSMEWNALASVTMTASTTSANYQDSDLILLGVYYNAEDVESLSLAEGSVAKTVDTAAGGVLEEVLTENPKALTKLGSMTSTIRVAGSSCGKSKRYVVLSLGKQPPKDSDDGTSLGLALGKAIAGKVASEKKVESCSVVLPVALLTADTLEAISSSFYAALYSDNRYRTGDKVKKLAEDLKTVTLIGEGGDVSSDAASALQRGQQMAAGIVMSKDIVNSPHNVLNSLSLAETAQRIAADSSSLSCKILGAAECEELGMGAFLGVARGSETEPQLIHMTYKPPSSGEPIKKKVGIVGKGLLFDTGGYNIKVAMMELMKFDCGGAAAVLGAARAIGALQPPGVEVHFVVAACENMINDKAYVPSDILTAANGKTIEVLNTDAEGRLTLADALVYADQEIGCDTIIELSTLTGSCIVSLGKDICGVWTSDDALAQQLANASKATGEKSWRMPLEEGYKEQLDSIIADLKNIGTRWGGSITAALFLENFVDKATFAHLDIAGPVWNDKTGATGYGARLVTEWVTQQGK